MGPERGHDVGQSIAEELPSGSRDRTGLGIHACVVRWDRKHPLGAALSSGFAKRLDRYLQCLGEILHAQRMIGPADLVVNGHVTDALY